MKHSFAILEKMAKVAETVAEDRRKFNDKYDILLTNILPNYEEQCVKEYSESTDKLCFMNIKVNGLAEAELNMSKAALRNHTLIVSEFIREELREILSFQEILDRREEYETAKFKAQARKKDL